MWQLALIPAALILVTGVILFVILGPALSAWLHDLIDIIITTRTKIREHWSKRNE